LQLARPRSAGSAAVHATPSWLWGVYKSCISLSRVKRQITLASQRFYKNKITLLFNRTSPSRTVPNRAFQQSIRFGSYIIRTVHCRARALGPRFGSVRARKFRAGRRFGSQMLGTVRYGSRMYGTGSPVCPWPQRNSPWLYSYCK